MKRLLAAAAVGAGAYLAYRALRPRYAFAGRHVLLTGGSRGLGLVLARQLVGHGAKVTFCSRTEEQVATAEAELTRLGGEVLGVECDVTNGHDVRKLVETARARFGPIHVLINNAGIISVGPLEEMHADDFELSLKTHFWGAYHAVTAVLPEMRARREGRIVNVSSFGGKVAVPHLLPYVVGKFALTGYSNGLRTEVAKDGVIVTTVCPGLLRTGSHVNAEFKGRHDEEYAWFALGGATPGLSISAESAARQILTACAAGDAEVVLSLPAKLAVAAQAIAPTLLADLSALVNRHIMPEPGGIGSESVKGHGSRGLLPAAATAWIDAAGRRNNETDGKMAGT